MVLCSKCKKENLDNAKFCIGCGASLIEIAHSTSAEISKQPDPLSYELAKPRQRNKTVILLLTILLLFGSATAVYFIFFNKPKTDDKNFTNKVEEPVADKPSTPKVVDSDPVPLKPGTQSQELKVSQTEVDNISRRIDEFYAYETREDISNLLSYYKFPLDRYYQLYNVDQDKLHKMIVEAFNGKLYYHSISINWKYSTVQKLATGGYKALLSAEYTSASQGEEDRKTMNIHLTIIMNDFYKITSIYPN